MAQIGTTVLQPLEIDQYVDGLECIGLEDVLTPRWVVTGCRVIQLSLQAALEASRGGHEHVQHSITLHNKGVALVWYLLAGEAWRLHLLPRLLDSSRGEKASSSLPFIVVLQTEAASLGLLENLVFHEDSAEALDGLVLDLIDYCARQLTRLAAHAHEHPDRPLYAPDEAGGGVREPEGAAGEVLREERRTALVLACRAVSVVQLLSCCLKRLPLCATTRLLRTHDVPHVLASLLHSAPWRTRRMVFQDGSWAAAGGEALGRTECQAWAALHALLLDPRTPAAYQVTGPARASLLKVRGRLDGAALAQVPALEPLARWLAALALGGPLQAGRPPPLVTTVAQLEGGVTGAWEGRWGHLADLLAPRFLSPSAHALRALAVRMASAWDLDALEALLQDAPACAACGGPAGRRCSRCRSQWYCRRECQVKHWTSHKRLCDLVAAHTSAKKAFIE